MVGHGVQVVGLLVSGAVFIYGIRVASSVSDAVAKMGFWLGFVLITAVALVIIVVSFINSIIRSRTELTTAFAPEIAEAFLLDAAKRGSNDKRAEEARDDAEPRG